MNLKYSSSTKLLGAALCGVALAGCNAIETTDGSPVIPTPTQTVVINGDVSGLSKTRPVELKVVLTNNGINNGTKFVSVRDTNVLRFGAVNAGAGYAITVNKTPVGRTCTIANGTGTATTDVENVKVTCVRDTTQLYTLTTSIASGLSATPPAGFKVTLTTEEGSETITPTAGQATVTFALPVFYPGGSNPPSFNYTVTATNTVGGTTNSCAVTNGTGSLVAAPAAPASPNVTNVNVSACTYTISAAATYSTPTGGTASAMGTGGLQLGLKSQLTGAIVAQAPLISAFSTTAVAIPGTWVSNSSALYEVVVQSNPANQTCIVENGGRAQLVTAQANVTVQVRCRDIPVLANQLKGVYQLEPRTVSDTNTAIAAPRVPTRNFLTFFADGTFIYGTHHATATAGVEHGFYNYTPGAATLGFTVWTDTNGGITTPTLAFDPSFLTGTGTTAIDWTAGLSGRANYTMPFTFSFTTFAATNFFPGNVTATNVVKTAGTASTRGTLSMQFGTFVAPPVAPATTPAANVNNVLTFTEPLNTAGQIEGAWATTDNKRVFVYNKTTFYGFHAGVNGAPNLQDACFTILDADLAESFYTRRGGDTGCMAASADLVDDARDGRVGTGTVDVPNATATNTTAPLIPGFEGRLPGAISNTILSPSPVHYKVTPGTGGNPDTLVIQNTLNDVSIGAPITFKRARTF
jgi:hypothetical protein